MTTIDFITELFCQVDDAMRDVPKHLQASLYPCETVTIGTALARQPRRLADARRARAGRGVCSPIGLGSGAIGAGRLGWRERPHVRCHFHKADHFRAGQPRPKFGCWGFHGGPRRRGWPVRPGKPARPGSCRA